MLAILKYRILVFWKFIVFLSHCCVLCPWGHIDKYFVYAPFIGFCPNSGTDSFVFFWYAEVDYCQQKVHVVLFPAFRFILPLKLQQLIGQLEKWKMRILTLNTIVVVVDSHWGNHLWFHLTACVLSLWLFQICPWGLSSLFSMQEEESEEEPKLKYERLSNGVTEILQKDAASCMTVHDKVRWPVEDASVTRLCCTFADTLRSGALVVVFHSNCVSLPPFLSSFSPGKNWNNNQRYYINVFVHTHTTHGRSVSNRRGWWLWKICSKWFSETLALNSSDLT